MPAAPPRPRTRRLPRDERISKILEVTRAVLAEKGYENIVTSEVAERCGVSEATIYKYFDSKRELLMRVAEQWFEDLQRQDHRSVAGHGALEALRQLVWRNLSVVRREPALTRFVLLDLRPDPDYRKMPVFELNRRFTAQVTEVLRAAVKNGELRGDVPVALLRDMVFGCIEHQTWAYLRGEGDFSVDQVADGIATVVFRGMRAEPVDAKAGVKPALGDVVTRLERVAAKLEQAGADAPFAAPRKARSRALAKTS